MEKDELSGLKLDEEYKNILALIRPHVLQINSVNDARLCRIWLDKLSHCSAQDRPLRNAYLSELQRQVEAGKFTGPFENPPPSGQLLPLEPTEIVKKNDEDNSSSSWSDVTESSVYRPRWRTDEGESCPPDSGDRPGDHHDHENCLQVQRKLGDRMAKEQVFLERYKHTLLTMYNKHQPKEDLSASKLSELQEMYERKVTTLNEVIQNLEGQNNKLNQELDRYQASLTVSNVNPSIASLADEVTSLKTKLTDLQRIKSALELSHKEVITQYQHEMAATIGQLSRRLHDAQLKNNNLELGLESVTKRLELLEQQHQQQMASEQLLTQQLKTQVQNQACCHQKKVAELQHKHIQEIMEVRATIDELKTKLAAKEKEVVSIEELLRQKSDLVQEQVKNIKKEIQHSSEKTEQKLKAKVWALQKAVRKHDRTKAKIIKDYDHRILQLQKERNIEATQVKGLQLQLQTQKAEISSSFAQDKQKQFEVLVQNLEERYRLLLEDSEKKYLQKQEEDQKRITELEKELQRVLKKK